MVKTALDVGQRLLGSAFLVAVLIPSALFLLVSVTLISGAGPVERAIQDLANGDWSKLSIGTIAFLVGTFLLAQVLASILGSVHRLYHGYWPSWVLRQWPARHMLAYQAATQQQRQWAVRDTLRQLNDPGWARPVAAAGLGFEPSSDVQLLDRCQVPSTLKRVTSHRDKLMRRVVGAMELPDDKYLSILGDARALQAAATRPRTVRCEAEQPGDLGGAPLANNLLDEAAIGDIERLIATLRNDYDEYQVLREAADRLYATAHSTYLKAYNELVLEFPTDTTWLRPTRLGNVAAAITAYPRTRYGIDWDSLWPRLLFVLPDPARQRIERASTYVDFAILMSLLSALSTGPASVASIAAGIRSDLPWFSLVVLGLLPALCPLSAWLFYTVAIGATRTLGEQAHAAIDLYRLTLLDALQIKRPSEPAREREIWAELHQFIAYDAARLTTVQFVATPAMESSPSTGAATGHAAAPRMDTSGAHQPSGDRDSPNE